MQKRMQQEVEKTVEYGKEHRLKIGLFEWIRQTSFLKFVTAWTISIFLFTLVYWISAVFTQGLSVNESSILFNYYGFIESLYASLLTATVFGVVKLTANKFYSFIVYTQLAFSAIIVCILIDKLLQKYVFPRYHAHHSQDKKLNTLILTMSIFRNDLDRIRSEFKSKTKHDVNIKEIEAVIDGLYVTFLDIDKLFSIKNIHKHAITEQKYLIVVINVEDSLHKLLKFIEFLENHKISWKDKSIEFWLRYILETADKITMHFDDVKLKNTKLIIALENIKELTESIEKKI
jgi:hypothetical protein